MKYNALPLERAGRLLIYFSIFVLPLANAPITADTLEIKIHLFRLLGFSAAVLYIVMAFGKASEPDAVDLAAVFSLAGLAVSLAVSESRVGSLPAAMDGAASLAFFCLARTVFSRSADPDRSSARARLILWVVGLSSILPALLFVAEYKRTGITDTLGNQNVVSHYLLLCLCAPIYVLARRSPHTNPLPRGEGVIKMVAALFLIAELWVIWLTAARGAVVGLLVALSVLAAISAARHWNRFPARSKVVVCAVCAILILLAPALLYTYATSKDFNVSVRFLSWKYSISLLTERLWFGYGPGLFANSFEKTKLWMAEPDVALLNVLTVNYAHNDYVELAVDQGAVGLSAFLFLVGVCLAPAAWRWIRRTDPLPAVTVALIFSLIASLAQAFFDFPYHMVPPRLLFYVMLGMVSAPRMDREENPEPRETAASWVGAAILVLVTAFLAVPVLTPYSASLLSKVAEPKFKAGLYDDKDVLPYHIWAARSDPTRSLYYFRQGLGEEMAGNSEGARQSFRTALSIQPYFPNLYFHMGTVSLKADPSRAAACFYSALAFSPNSASFHNLAAMGLALADSPAAASIYTEISRRYPDDDQARRNAQVLLTQGEQKPEIYRRALELYQRNQLDTARTYAERFLKDRPNDADGIFLLGRILFHQGHQEESLRYFKTYSSLNPTDAEAYYYIGNAHFVQGRHAESLPYFLQAARLNTGSPKILYNLGVSYFTVGDTSSMNDCFDTVLSINPNVSTKSRMEELRRAARMGRSP